MQKLFFMIFIFIVAVVLCPANAHAQQTSSAAEKKQATEKAFELLKSLAGELGTLQSAENRARIGSNIAGSLWPHDENRARALFALVQQDINTGLQVPESPTQEGNKTLMVFLKLRADTIERIAKHDPELAYSFFKATGLSSEKRLPEHVRQSERALESHMAKQLANSNPDLSLEIARKMLARGFSDDLRLLLVRLNRKHKEQAKALYKEIVRKLSDTNLAHWTPRYFALNLANSFAPPAVDESTYRDLVNLFVKAMFENGCTTKPVNEDERVQICRGLGAAIPLIAKVDPSSVSRLQHWSNEGGYYYSPPSAYSEVVELSADSSVDDTLALIAQYPQMEAEIRFQAMYKAERDGDLERARKIATEYTGDPEKQRQMLARLDDQARASINSIQLEEVQKRVSELQGTLQQAGYLMGIANQLADNDRKASLKLLNQAAEIVDTMKPGKQQTAMQMFLAIVYCYEKSNRGFAIMESLMPKLNELVASAAKLDGYDTRYLRDGEWNMTAEGELGSLLTGLAQHAGYFGWCDFDRAVSMAGQFERPEIRMMAQLKLAQGILAGPPKRLHVNYTGFQR